jgi:hypothetical protein
MLGLLDTVGTSVESESRSGSGCVCHSPSFHHIFTGTLLLGLSLGSMLETGVGASVIRIVPLQRRWGFHLALS